MYRRSRPFLRISNGKNALEARAIDAYLKRLQIRICPETRIVEDAGPRIKGGIQGMLAVAQRGEAQRLDLEGLSKLPLKWQLAHFGSEERQRALAKERLERCITTLENTTLGLRKHCEQYWVTGELSRDGLDTLTARMSKIAGRFSVALGPQPLSYATPNALRRLASAYAEYLGAYSRYQVTFQEMLNRIAVEATANSPVLKVPVNVLP